LKHLISEDNPLGIQNNNEIGSWIAYDFEWITKDKKLDRSLKDRIDKNTSGGSVPPENDKTKCNDIVTFAFEDSNGIKGCLDITEFSSAKFFLEAIKEKLLEYQYCFAWGSKSVMRKNHETGIPEGINGDLAVLDSNLRIIGIPTIIRYDKYSNTPFITNDIFANNNRVFKADIDLLQVFAKPLVRSIFKNKYKSLRLDDVSIALLGFGKLDNKTGAKLYEMSIEERKSYCLHDAHLVAELIRANNGGDVLRIMKVIASHTTLTFEEVCHKGMTGIWKKILNDAISKKINLVGYENMPSALRKLYSNNSNYGKYRDYHLDKEYEYEYEDGNENEEIPEYKENSYDDYIALLAQRSKNRNLPAAEYDISYNSHPYDKGKNNEKLKTEFKSKYKGGLVLCPKRGLHNSVFLFDVTSLYPTMIINYNISPETVNCSCCRNDVKARLFFDKDILNDLHHGFSKDPERIYWICQHRKGLFSGILQELTEKRIEYKNKGKELESVAIKVIINSGYGVFGHSNFKYYDPKVAEVITALGRRTLLEMKKIAEEMGFAVLYGDTDSLFVDNKMNTEDISKFINVCKKKLKVDVNHEKTFRKLILVGKKHYIGIPCSDAAEQPPTIKGMEGIKSDRPEFIQTTFREMVKGIQNDVNPIPKLKHALEELDRRQVPKERLAISLLLTKNPQEFANDCLQKRLGTKLGLKKGDILIYYKCDKDELIYDTPGGKERTRIIGESDNSDDISYAKYKEMLINSVKDVIEILGYNVEKDLLVKRQLSQQYLS